MLHIFQMSGLDVNTSQILEIACLITNKDLKVVSKDLNIIIHQPDEILNNMNDWCLATHQKVNILNEFVTEVARFNNDIQTFIRYIFYISRQD